MALAAGEKLGAYEITSCVGAGGMGNVYRALDTKLGRVVALKMLPEATAHDARRMARFEREARTLASLNHPNIAAIYGLEESNGVCALVMELVEGQTLAERIAGAGLPSARGRPQGSPLQESLAIAKQIAEALEYAHERGVIHRDLKPANVKITPEGMVKVLDFGLAKPVAPDFSPADIDADLKISSPDSTTRNEITTHAGMILGTAAYMSPEQAKGQPVDRRCDIWAFGCVLYEMLSGKRAFEGETFSDVLAAVIRAEPDWTAIPETTPPAIRRLIRRCLVKDPKQRLRDIGDARFAIEEELSGTGVSPVTPHEQDAHATPASNLRPSREKLRSPLRHTLPWALGCLFLGALISGLFVRKIATPGAKSAMRISAVTNFAGVQAKPALSLDGRSVAFVSNRDGHYNLYVGLVRGGNLVQITHDPNLKSRPAWSPDGGTIAYARLNDSGIWDIWEVPALGGTSRRLILNARDPDYSHDGLLLAYANMADGGIWVSGRQGENARQVAASQVRGWKDMEPRFSADGRQIVFTIQSRGPHGELRVVDLASGRVRQLTQDEALALSPAWSPDGRSIYFASNRGGTVNIWKIPATGGEPEQITCGRGDDALLDLSRDGRSLVFSTFRENVNIAQLGLEAGSTQQILKFLSTDPARNQFGPVYSPDGKLLAYFTTVAGDEKESIWVTGVDGSNPLPLARDGRINIFPRWAPDGEHIIYFSRTHAAPDHTDEYRSVPITGGSPRTLLAGVTDVNFDVGRDGRLLFRGPSNEIQAFDPWESKTETVATLPADINWQRLRWSPDQRSVAYTVDPVREDDPDAGLWVHDLKGSRRQIFKGWVGWYAVRPGNEIYFLEAKPDLSGDLWKVQWNGEGLTRVTESISMFYSFWVNVGQNSQEFFDVSPDGRHLAFDMQTVLQANISMIENVM